MLSKRYSINNYYNVYTETAWALSIGRAVTKESLWTKPSRFAETFLGQMTPKFAFV